MVLTQVLREKNMEHRYLALLFIGLAVSCGSPRTNVPECESGPVNSESVCTLGFEADSLMCREGKVKNGQFFSTLMMHLGLNAQQAYDLAQACAGVFDVKTLRVGNAYKAYYSAVPDTVSVISDEVGASSLQYVVYDRDRTSRVIFSCQPPYEVKVHEKTVTTERRYADVTINTSLWVDMREADVSPELIISLSDIYAWTVDFFGLRKGDRFRVLYEEKSCDGEVVAVDTVRYAVFTRGNEHLPSIMYDQKDGGNIYWNEKGESMRKAFLKAPLKFSRISSGFSYARRHPVTRRVQPHTGVDYAAPKGTPVMSIGDGVVTGKKYEGAGGNTVRIRHNSVYSTAYLHLSAYAKGLKVGQRVRQGQVIGYVGSTGRSTGPHLDFRVWKNGSPINPLKMQSPPAEPLKDANRESFKEAHAKYKAQIDTIQARSVASELFGLL